MNTPAWNQEQVEAYMEEACYPDCEARQRCAILLDVMFNVEREPGKDFLDDSLEGYVVGLQNWSNLPDEGAAMYRETCGDMDQWLRSQEVE